MIIEPKIRGFICTTAHPTGCFKNVENEINYIKQQKEFETKKNVLVVGCSTGYGLASRICCAFSKSKSSTIGVMLEKPATEKRTATAGFYNTAAFEKIAKSNGIWSKTINADAFSNKTIETTIDTIKSTIKKVDLIIYSLAAPRRTMPDSTIVSSTLKTVNNPYTNKTLNLRTKKIEQTTIEPATKTEIENTIKVMGGENWLEWLTALKKADAVSNDALTISYSYIGPKLTFPIYKNGTIGLAKDDLFKTAKKIKQTLNIKALISINKALVTQASSAIPIVPLYLTILYKIMKKNGCHEGCIEQMHRLFSQKINFKTNTIDLDEEGRIRLDDLELNPKIQEEVETAWQQINNENLTQFADLTGYLTDFEKMFGFGLNSVNYDADVNQFVSI